MIDKPEVKVTAVMVTANIPERKRLMDQAIECFYRQTHPNKDLLIVNQGEPLGFPNEILVDPRVSLGDMRNIGLSHAQKPGCVISWDDDDYHHPDRMSKQLKPWRGRYAVIQQNQIVYNLQSEDARVITAKHWKFAGYPGSVLHDAICPFRYPSIPRGEDSEFIKNWRVAVIDNDPKLYVRFIHGYNTSGNHHIENLLYNSRPLSLDEKQYLDDILGGMF